MVKASTVYLDNVQPSVTFRVRVDPVDSGFAAQSVEDDFTTCGATRLRYLIEFLLPPDNIRLDARQRRGIDLAAWTPEEMRAEAIEPQK